ncbi:hypothetical protein [Streptomyces sp. NPDC097619]|uniref:hypothetical protein n=1 Tax=Streptomyces sp. NPDC097619 TaxID=3157228 RepID=UPI00331E651B
MPVHEIRARKLVRRPTMVALWCACGASRVLAAGALPGEEALRYALLDHERASGRSAPAPAPSAAPTGPDTVSGAASSAVSPAVAHCRTCRCAREAPRGEKG